MSILVDKNSKVIVQGITGHEGSFHAGQMIEYGTNIVGGVTPGKGGQMHLDRPVFNTVSDAVKATGADVSIIFVPPPLAADAILEAADSGIELIVCITEGIPVKDMITVKEYLRCHGVRMIGPNCPGIITPPSTKIGIMPGFIHTPGTIGIVSRSGTLSYEAVDQITKAGLGGDPIPGTTIAEAVQMFMADSATEGIIMIGEIGGNMETDAGYWIQQHGTKPVVSFIAGATAPKGRTMGHAGAIVGGVSDTAEAKKEILRQCGIHVVDSPADLGAAMVEELNKLKK